MRSIRQSLMQLLHEAGQQYQVGTLPPRLRAAMLHDAMTLLPIPGEVKSPVALHVRTISHGSLHRHMLMIRCPDQAFYLDAIKNYLSRHHIQTISHQTVVAALHCDDQQCQLFLTKPEDTADDNFMLIAIHLSATMLGSHQRLSHCDQHLLRVNSIADVARDIESILQAVELSVADFPLMREKVQYISQHMMESDPIEAELLHWMNDDHYILYGLAMDGWRKGLMRHSDILDAIIPDFRTQMEQLPAAQTTGLEWLSLPALLNHIYTPSRMEVVRISWLEHEQLQQATLIGYFSRSGRYTNASEIPRLRQTWQSMCQARMVKYSSFYRREIRTLFDRMPKPVLLGVPGQDWLQPLKEITDLSSPTQLTVARLIPDAGTTEFLMMTMMSDRYGPNIMNDIRHVMQDEGLCYYDHIAITMGSKQVIIAAVSCTTAWPVLHHLHAKLQDCIVFWKDRAKRHVLAQANSLNIPEALRELETLPRLYQELYPPEQFLADLQASKRIQDQQRHLVRMQMQAAQVMVHIYSHTAIPLGVLIERVQAFGLLALQESMVNFGHADTSVHLITLRCQVADGMAQEALERLSAGVEAVLNDEADHDPINRLLVYGGLSIRDIAVLITLRNHLIQLLPDAAPGPLSEMMNQYPHVAAQLYRVFEAMHRPAMPGAASAQHCLLFKNAMQAVSSLTHDRWFRALESMVLATLRSNAYSRDLAAPLAIKIDPGSLDFIPRPKPFREIFVHGIHVEGVHLRAGAVARGGIRYSDRPNDFRTEVLELMATQTVKNGQILPTGAKGGFIIRNTTGDYATVLQQYRNFIRALLEMTDNLVDGEIIAPANMRIATVDQQDPYLVVAADKGTARFSDDANEVSAHYGYWLGDAFASGGRYGYDHKVVGITARGAWVCAEQHFRTLGRDAAIDPISVVGIGDMAGDVFGNGMLINPNIRLIAAFNHRHIFLDPNPDTTLAFAERQRLFNAVAGWDAYDTACISSGGGVFERSSKNIPLSSEIAAVLAIDADAMPGEALIRAILKAPVDLLYNGGIGAYVKASDETHADVRDPANNQVRVNGDELRCSVVCEGGNLGFTQQARIEYAQQGGLIHTDAIDNAAGVNMSDHEVNIKILFSATDAASIPFEERNTMLREVADAVTTQCLNDNRQQAIALMLAQWDARHHLPRLVRLREQLLHDRRLDLRVDTGMHDDLTLPLLPQLAVLLGHEKNRVHDALNEEKLADWSLFAGQLLKDYFPAGLHHRLASKMEQHPLRMSLAHTCVSNHVLNHNGIISVHYVQSLLDASVACVCEALMMSEALLNSLPIQEAVQHSQGDARMLKEIQHGIQEYHLQFSEELLRLCDIQSLDQAWLNQQQRGLKAFCETEAVMGVGGNENSRFLVLLREAVRSGLNKENSSHLAMLPELAQMAPALYLSTKLNLPLKPALHAMQAVLHLLPFSAIEAPMRSSDWGDGEAHLLRREWFHRLTQLKAKAGESLLRGRDGQYIEAGETRWSRHRHWASLQEFSLESAQQGENNGAASESQRTMLMLMIARLESIIEECV